MYSLEKIRQAMQERLNIDKEINQVVVIADTIDEALADASVQLDTKISSLEYEVVERGSDGILGIGKKAWRLRIYPNMEAIKNKITAASSEDLFASDGIITDDKPVDKDGFFYVRHFGSFIKLKVLLPEGNGRPVSLKEVLDTVSRPDTEEIDSKLIEKYIAAGTGGEYETVGSYKHIASADASVSVDVSKDEMHATITVDAPGMSGAELTSDVIIRHVKAQGVLCGINEERINEFVDNPVYSVPYEVASAILPEDGHDSFLSFNFETDPSKLKAAESAQGNVDFKELNRIQNVVKGQVLAVKNPATRGHGGKTLFGHYLAAKEGKEIPVQLGANVEYEKDGVTIVASVDGQVLLVNGKITVQPVLFQDAVNIKTGNITFLGTVIVKGNVEDGMSIKASGNIEIGGSVGNGTLEADGSVIISQGVFGKNEGRIKAGRSVWAKFIQETVVEAEENVVASDSLMNCEVTSMKNIILYGKKAQITGGHLFAVEEICARSIGSPAGGTNTELTVGVDPRAKKKLDELQENQSSLVKELENIELDISNLEQQEKVRRSLPKDKAAKLVSLRERREQIDGESSEINQEIKVLQQHLRDLKAVGKVKVEGTVYQGTRIYVRDVLDEVKNDVNGVTFYYEDAFARRSKWEPPSFDISKGPDFVDTAD